MQQHEPLLPVLQVDVVDEAIPLDQLVGPDELNLPEDILEEQVAPPEQ